MSMYEFLISSTGLKITSGFLLLGYWFSDNYRRGHYEAQKKAYDQGLAVLRFIGIERTVIQTLSGPTRLVGLLANKAQSQMNYHISECETLAGMYDVAKENNDVVQRIRKRAESYLYRYASGLVKMKGGPGGELSLGEQLALQHRCDRCVKFIRGRYQKLFPNLDLGRYNTSVRLVQLERRDRRFYWVTSLLFILGSILAWFS